MEMKKQALFFTNAFRCGKIKKIAHPPYQSKISETSESSIYPILIGIGCFSFYKKEVFTMQILFFGTA